jgi:cytochrome c
MKPTSSACRIESFPGSAARLRCWAAAAVILFAWGGLACQPAQAGELQGARILVMSKTAGYRHASIPAGQAALLDVARQEGFTVTFTEDAEQFNDGDLGRFDAVVFLNTTGDILDPAQQTSFERYVEAGHGLLGIHAATDTETDGSWPWYTALIGARFKSHPPIQEARLVVANPTDRILDIFPSLHDEADLRVTDEWYDFDDVSSGRQPLVEIDRASYDGSTATGLEPIVWRNDFSGGRAYYIGLGHSDESYASSIMRDLIVQGLHYVVGGE